MAELTTRERFVRTLTGQDTDRVPFMKCFGGDNMVLPPWEKENPGISRYIDELLKFEGGYRGWRKTPVNVRLCGDIRAEVIEEDDRFRTVRYSYGMVEKQVKDGDYHAHTIEYPVKDWEDWEKIKRDYLNPDDPARFPLDWHNYSDLYRDRDYPLQLTYGGVYGFARNMMGDENLCLAFYDDPELVHDIMDTYCSVVLKIWEKECRTVQYDLIESWEDMAGKTGAIISPATFREFLAPNFRRIRAFADEHNIPIVLVDSDGNIDALAEQMNEAGVSAMYPFEVGAGCQVLDVLKKLPHLGAIAGLEKNACALGDEAIEAEMEKARQLIRNGRCIPGPDHIVLENVTFEGYRKFMTRLREVILTTKPGS